MLNFKIVFWLFVHFILGIFIGHVLIPKNISNNPNCISLPILKMNQPRIVVNTSLSHIQIINVTEKINTEFRCIKTKTLLNYVSTSICLHDPEKDVFVSSAFRDQTTIWEEGGVSHILQLLLRHPHLDFIDIGANIGTYTMYAASLGRFVLAIDCFGPNVQRLHRAVQLANVDNRVLLIQNAIFSRSGELLRLSNEARNIGGQAINPSKYEANNQSVINDPYLVKTIQLDDLLPLLTSRGIRGAIMKIDIEGSESFVVESGRRIFDTLEIPFVQMEWMNVRQFPERVEIILKFFSKRNYQPLTLACQPLNVTLIAAWPDDLFWIKKNSSGFC